MKSIRIVAGLVAVALALAASAQAQGFGPDRQLKIVVPFAAGAAADNGFRAISDKLAAALGSPVVIDNRPGAGGVLGAQVGAKAAPDGLTLIGGSDPPFTINPHLQKLSYDPLKDFEPVSFVAELPMALAVRSDLNVSTVQELIALAKAAPGKYTIASSGNGSSGHLAAEMLKSMAGIDLLHVPFKGMPQAVTDMLGGRVDITFSSLGPIMSHVQGGKLKILALSTAQRLESLPQVPTVAEAGVPGFNIAVWLGLLYPAHTPRPLVERVSAEVDRILQTPEVRARFRELGYVPVGGAPEKLAQRIRADHAKFARLIKEAKIIAE